MMTAFTLRLPGGPGARASALATALLATSLLTPSSVPGQEEEPRLTAISWGADFAVAEEAAKKEKKPLFVDFEAEWCGFCKKLDRETYTDERVIRLFREKLVAVKVDFDKEVKLRERFGVSALPTLFLVSPTGSILQRLEGFRPPEQLLEEVGRSLESSATLERLREDAQRSPRDAAVQRAYARALLAAKDSDGALATLEAALEAAGAQSDAAPGILLDLGDTLRVTGKLAEARKAYERILQRKPDGASPERSQAYLPLGHVLVGLRDAEGAVSVLGAYLGELPPVPQGESPSGERLEALFLRGYAHAMKKDAPRAMEDLKAVREADPQGPWGVRASLILDIFERS